MTVNGLANLKRSFQTPWRIKDIADRNELLIGDTSYKYRGVRPSADAPTRVYQMVYMNGDEERTCGLYTWVSEAHYGGAPGFPVLIHGGLTKCGQEGCTRICSSPDWTTGVGFCREHAPAKPSNSLSPSAKPWPRVAPAGETRPAYDTAAPRPVRTPSTGRTPAPSRSHTPSAPRETAIRARIAAAEARADKAEAERAAAEARADKAEAERAAAEARADKAEAERAAAEAEAKAAQEFAKRIHTAASDEIIGLQGELEATTQKLEATERELETARIEASAADGERLQAEVLVAEIVGSSDFTDFSAESAFGGISAESDSKGSCDERERKGGEGDKGDDEIVWACEAFGDTTRAPPAYRLLRDHVDHEDEGEGEVFRAHTYDGGDKSAARDAKPSFTDEEKARKRIEMSSRWTSSIPEEKKTWLTALYASHSNKLGFFPEVDWFLNENL